MPLFMCHLVKSPLPPIGSPKPSQEPGKEDLKEEVATEQQEAAVGKQEEGDDGAAFFITQVSSSKESYK